jgi:hypothetical protein
MRAAKVLFLSWVGILLLTQVSLAKNGDIGIYGIVDKVVFEPSKHSPQRIQIWGLFVVPVPMSSGEYKTPERGASISGFRLAGRGVSGRNGSN